MDFNEFITLMNNYLERFEIDSDNYFMEKVKDRYVVTNNRGLNYSVGDLISKYTLIDSKRLLFSKLIIRNNFYDLDKLKTFIQDSNLNMNHVTAKLMPKPTETGIDFYIYNELTSRLELFLSFNFGIPANPLIFKLVKYFKS
jgi:hypothetical protein